MSFVNTSLNRIKSVHNSIKQMKNIDELIDYVPVQGMQRVAAFLLIVWILTPLFVMIRNLILQDVGKFTAAIYWVSWLRQIGFLGCILGIIMFLKSLRSIKKGNTDLRQYFKINKLPIFLGLMLLWSVFSCLLSDDPLLSFRGDTYRNDGLVSYFAYSGIFCCGYIIRQEKFIQRILNAFTLSAASMSILILINSVTLNELLGLTPNAAVFSNINHFGYYICLAIPCVLLLLLKEKNSLALLIFRLLLFAAMVAALVQNKSFGPFLAVVTGLICICALILLLQKTRIKRVIVALVVFMVVTLFMNISDQHLIKDIKVLGGDIGMIATNAEDVEHAGSGRWPLLVNGVHFILERPLFGFGPDNLAAQYAKLDIEQDRPHNELIQFAASLGIPALVFYLCALVTHLNSYHKKRKRLTMMEIGLFCALLTYMFSSMFGNTMYYTTPYFLMFLSISGGMIKS